MRVPVPERTDKFQAASTEEPPLFRTEHTVSGEVDKILFSSEDASWRVVRLHDAEGNPAVAAGDLPGVMPGQHAVFTGTWENHKEYGRRLKVRTFHVSPPVTEEGIRRYLASGLLPGIGEKTAALIVRRFGRDTLNILDSAPKRLAEIPGLGRKKIEAVRKAWKENTENRTLRIQLEGYGISPAYFRKITSIYGNDAAEKIRENPYQLADDVKGIGFQLADRIAEKAGIGKNDPKRLAAGVLYAFRQMRQTGHVCMPEDLFTESLADLLGITKAEAETAWKDAMRAGHAIRMPGPGGTGMIYEPVMMRLENELPFRIGHLLSCRNHCGTAMRSVPPLPGFVPSR